MRATLSCYLLGFFVPSILEHSPLANVALNISPVPVLNCELLSGPEALSAGSFVLLWVAVEVLSDVREHSLQLGSHVRWKASTYLFQTRKTWKNAILKGVELFSLSLTTSLENPEQCTNIALAFYLLPEATQFERLNPTLCGSGEIKMTIKHLLTVVRRSAALLCFRV